ncbi:MAG: LysR family transcriptional regulator [Clostridia bacterium]|nr:LysR family transcriptional regulator [Clostridia bacterium]
MEILQLKYFQHAAKSENISHTAHLFMVPPSSVSASIKKLEKELDVRLFDRTSNSLKLNENGRIFLRAIDAAEKEIKKAKIKMLDLSSVPAGEIRLLILTNRGQVTESIAEFKMNYPHVMFSITHEDYIDYENYGKFDIVITDREIDSDLFTIRNFIREEILLAVHKNSALSEKKTIDLNDLKSEKFISMQKGSSIRDYLEKMFKKTNFEPDIAIECDDPYFVRKYLKMGLGVALFPSVSWKEQLDENIKLIRINDGMYRNSHLYINKTSSSICEMFVNTLELRLIDLIK